MEDTRWREEYLMETERWSSVTVMGVSEVVSDS